MITPRQVVEAWIEAFNRADVEALSAMYHDDAINHQVANEPVTGRDAITAMFAREFAAAEMVCIKDNLFEDGDWAILEWRDPQGLRGCGFFQVIAGRIAFQRLLGQAEFPQAAWAGAGRLSLGRLTEYPLG